MARFFWYALASAVLTYSVVQHAFATREQFYPTVIYLVTSKFSLVTLCNMALVIIIATAKVVETIFLGKLRDREVQVRRACQLTS